MSPTRRAVALLITAFALMLAGTLLAVSPAVSLPGSSQGFSPASRPASTDRSGTLIDFGRRNGRAVLPWSTADIAAAPSSFRAFARRELRRIWRQELGKRPACKTSPMITLDTLRTDGFALGDVATRPRRGCATGGGYIAIWAVRAGAWKQVIGTQEAVACRRLKRFDIPAELGIDACYRGNDLVPYNHP